MLFSSFSFLLFLPLAIVVLAVARYRSQPALLTAMILVSLVFYGWFRADYVLILIGSALVNYSLAVALERWPDKRIFAAGVIFNVGLLGVFKYLDFIIGNADAVSGARWPLPHIVLPLALSFITFEQISFLSDVRCRRVQRSDRVDWTRPAGIPPVSLWIASAAALALAASVIFMAKGAHNAFIYFQF